MADKLASNLAALDEFLKEKGWRLWEKKDIEHGCQISVTDGTTRMPINFYQTGKIVPQGKAGALKTAITEWANLRMAGLDKSSPADPQDSKQNRIAKYLVLPDSHQKIRDLVHNIEGTEAFPGPAGPAEIYRVEIRSDGQRITVTQYSSGTLIVQGHASHLFDHACETLDQHLIQSFSARATRYLPGDNEHAVTTSYLESPNAENDAATWLFGQLDAKVIGFLHENDRQTLLAGAGVRNAISTTHQSLPDYYVVVMPFAKVFEGFMIRLAEHLGLTTKEALAQKSSSIEVGNWLLAIRDRLPDVKRYGEISDALDAAWGCRNKAMHSDFIHPVNVLKTSQEAEMEIATILRAMSRTHAVFVELMTQLRAIAPSVTTEPALQKDAENKFQGVDRSSLLKKLQQDGFKVEVQPAGRKNAWEIIDKPDIIVTAPSSEEGLIVVRGKTAGAFCNKYRDLLVGRSAQPAANARGARIGVDESGKGDVFGPLVVAAVRLTPEAELELAKRGVRDSKTLSDTKIAELAELIRHHCEIEILVLLPPEYNTAYEERGSNLNRLLAWGHAKVITGLNQRAPAGRAISDQFAEKSLLIEALAAEGCQIELEQRPKAESDTAVAAASIIARAEFVAAMDDYTAKAGIAIPLGASADEVKEIGRRIFRKWGIAGMQRIAKMHFKTVQEIMGEAKQ